MNKYEWQPSKSNPVSMNADQIAREVAENILGLSEKGVDLATPQIATALREYGEAEYQRGINSINSLVEVMDQGKIKQEARHAALQEAAKIIEGCAGPSAKDLANKVRALAPSDSKGEK